MRQTFDVQKKGFVLALNSMNDIFIRHANAGRAVAQKLADAFEAIGSSVRNAPAGG
jgi:hypothetical protein